MNEWMNEWRMSESMNEWWMVYVHTTDSSWPVVATTSPQGLTMVECPFEFEFEIEIEFEIEFEIEIRSQQ